MSMFINDDRWGPGMFTDQLEPQPVSGAEDMAGMVAIVTHHGPEGGMTYEQCEPVGQRHHRVRSSGPIPGIVRPA